MFPKDEKGEFSARACIIDIIAIGVSLALPVVVWVLSLFGKLAAFSTLWHVLMGVYIVWIIAMVTVHEVTGCRKCEIVECPTSRAAKQRKRMMEKPSPLS